MNVGQWLATKVSGFDKLKPKEVQAINEFTFMWTYFEHRACNNFAFEHAIKDAVEKLDNSGHSLQMGPFMGALQYYSNRYFPNGAASNHFQHLRFQKKKHVTFVADTLTGSLNTPREQVHALLLIAYRLRNNLFHGEKWAYGIAGQRENFIHAACVLAAFIDQYDAAGL